MESKNITLEEVYHRLSLLERALRAKGIIVEEETNQYKLDDEGELRDEVKVRLEQARKTPLSEYIDHEEVKKRILHRK